MKFFSKKNKSEKRSSLTLEDNALLKALGINPDGISGDKMKEATFFTCIKILSESIAKLPMKVYKQSTDGAEKVYNHNLYNMLSVRPNKHMSSIDFLKTIMFQRNYYGFSVVAIETMPNGKVKGLYPLDSKNIQIWVDDKAILSEIADVWFIYSHNGKEYKFRSDEVLHFKGLTMDGIHSYSVKNQLSNTVETLQNSSSFMAEHFGNGLSVGGVMQYVGDLDENSVNKMKAYFEKMATGVKNAGKILPVPVGFNFNTINPSMVDNQFLELNQLSIRQICSAFGIKPHMLGDLSQAKFNNVQQMNEQFYTETLLPIIIELEQEMNYKLLTEREVKQGYFIEFNVDMLLRADLKTRYEAYGIGIDKGFLTPNEARHKENLPKYDGGDQLIVNGTYVPLNKVGMHSDNYNESLKGGEENE